MKNESPGKRKNESVIITVDSRKGGVGKTTLALAIAKDFLEDAVREESESRFPVVMIDADIFGTEIADALLPFEKGKSLPERWDLGLLEVLTQSSGGLRVFEETLKRKLEPLLKGTLSRSMPIVTFADPVDTGASSVKGPGEPADKPRGYMLLIPTYSGRDPAERGEVRGRDSLAMTMIADTFGYEQMRIRLQALVKVILETLQPICVIIDNAPFHLPISQVSKGWLEDNPFDGASVRHLDVIGPEEHDLSLRAQDLLNISQPQYRDRRWVINRDIHLGAGKDPCVCRTLLSGLVVNSLLDRKIGHVLLNEDLYLGSLGRNVTTTNVAVGASGNHEFQFQAKQTTPKYLDMISKSFEANRMQRLVNDGAAGGWRTRTWAQFFGDAFSESGRG